MILTAADKKTRVLSFLFHHLRELEDLHERNATLQAEVDDLRQGLQAIEERARSELGMVKDDEEFYQVVPRKDDGL